MKIKVAATVASLAALAFASQAFANTFTVTYAGIVDASKSGGGEDFDTAGLFGGGNLENDVVTSVLTYDTSRGTEAKTSTSDQLTGGPQYADQVTGNSPADPVLSVSVTINAHTYTFSPDYGGEVSTTSGSKGSVQQDVTSTNGADFMASLNTATAPASLSTPFIGAGTGTGSLLTDFFSTPSGGEPDTITFDTLGVVVAAAPEPSMWALMIAGVGVMGGALRRRRSPLAASY